MIYERKRGIKYIVINGYSRPDGVGGREIKPTLMADFSPISDVNQMGVCDTRRTAEKYVDMEVATGRLAPSSRDKRVGEIDRHLQSFIEGHVDYDRDGGLGLIRKQKTREERAADLRAQAQAMIERAQELDGKVDEMSEEELEKATEPEKKSDGMAKPVDVVTGAATIANARATK